MTCMLATYLVEKRSELKMGQEEATKKKGYARMKTYTTETTNEEAKSAQLLKIQFKLMQIN